MRRERRLARQPRHHRTDGSCEIRPPVCYRHLHVAATAVSASASADSVATTAVGVCAAAAIIAAIRLSELRTSVGVALRAFWPRLLVQWVAAARFSMAFSEGWG